MRFNADNHQNEFEPIEGRHRFRINQVSGSLTQAGNPMLLCEMQIIEGKYRNRRHTDRFILEHANEKVVSIALGKLSSLSRCVGRPQWEHENELVGLVGEALFGPQKDNAEYTEIKRYIVPDETKGAPASNPHRDVNARNGQLNNAIAASSGRAEPPDYTDDDVPF